MRRLRGTAHFMEREGVDSGLVWDWWLMKSSVRFFCGASSTVVFIGGGGVDGISRLWVSRNWHTKGSRLSARVGAVSCICFINAVMTVAWRFSFFLGFSELTARIMTLMPLKWCWQYSGSIYSLSFKRYSIWL